jgi:uncharacterized protein YgiM (DUF1202 family)
MSAVLPSQPQKGVPQPTTSPGVTATTQVGTTNGPSTLVSVPSLNVRSAPSKQATVQTVVTQGTSVVVLAHKGNWYKVQLPNGQIGWVVAAGIGQVTSTTVANPTVGTPTAPKAQGYPAAKATASAAVKVTSLNVHSSPSLNAPVVNSVSKGQKVQVIGRKGTWLKVLLPDGTVGWISSAYTSARASTPRKSASTTARTPVAAGSKTVAGGSKAKVAVNVRSGPSLNNSVVTTIPAGGTDRVLGWSNGWAHVQLPNGTVGWVSGSVIGGASSATPTYNTYTPRKSSKSKSTSRSSAGASARNVLTAGVRVHSAPGVKAPVVTVAAAGTHVTVLGYRAGWVLVRLPNGTTGYVLGSYVR